MMAGSSFADVALLVVSAQNGEFEAGIARNGGMTREEALIVYAMGIRNFIVLVTKMELVGYSELRFQEISSEVLGVLKALGITPLAIIPVSGLSGDGLVEPPNILSAYIKKYVSTFFFDKMIQNMQWFAGSPASVIEALNSIEPPARMYDAPVRIPIIDVCIFFFRTEVLLNMLFPQL